MKDYLQLHDNWHWNHREMVDMDFVVVYIVVQLKFRGMKLGVEDMDYAFAYL